MFNAAALLFVLQTTAVDPAVVDWIKSSLLPIKSVVAESGFDDLEPIGRAIGDARIVALGEATHGSREVFQMKHRLLEYLVTKKGFTAFGIEASYPGCLAINEYVLRGKGDPEKALSGQGFWTWDTEECLEMIKWMRRYNASPENTKKLTFYGIDMQNMSAAIRSALDYLERFDSKLSTELEPELQTLLAARTARDVSIADPQALARSDSALLKMAKYYDDLRSQSATLPNSDDFVDAVQAVEVAIQARELYRLYLAEPVSLATPEESVLLRRLFASASHLSKLLDPTRVKEIHWLGQIRQIHSLLQTYRFESIEARKDMHSAIESILKDRDSLLSKSTERDRTEEALSDLMQVVMICEQLSSYRSPLEAISRGYFSDMTGSKWRDRCMAKNAEWLLRKQGVGGRIVLWAHNIHIDKQLQFQNLGFNLRARDLGYYAIGFSLLQGSLQARTAASVDPTLPLRKFDFGSGREGYFDHTLAQAGVDKYFLSFNSFDPKVQAWFRKRQMMRFVGSTFNPNNDSHFTQIVPQESFDAVIFLQDTTRAIPTRAVRERFNIKLPG